MAEQGFIANAQNKRPCRRVALACFPSWTNGRGLIAIGQRVWLFILAVNGRRTPQRLTGPGIISTLVKMTDDPDDLPLLVTLEQLVGHWREEFAARMAQRGFAAHGTAAGELLAHLGEEPVSQSLLTLRSGLSKQAVQQLLDQLEAQGAIVRLPDPADRRAKRIGLTPLGLKRLAARQQVLGELDAAIREAMGKKTAKRLRKALKAITPLPASTN